MTRASFIAGLFVLFAACGDEGSSETDGTTTTTTTSEDDTVEHDSFDVSDSSDTSDVEVINTGFPCNEDESCFSGLCYGRATLQGHFEPAECQSKCLNTFDFDHYCDSDADCCRGKCCVDCAGAQNGLCLLGP